MQTPAPFEVAATRFHDLAERLDVAERLLAAQREPSHQRLTP
ncbi:MAG: hypothetical protein ACRELE_03550 [Gemmatimonadales bacterium]